MRESNIIRTFGGHEKGTSQKESPWIFADDCTHTGGCAQLCVIVENTDMDRIAMLSEVLSQDPNNVFARYSLAMEYSNSGQLHQAIEEFEKLLAAHPDYAAGYFMAQTLVKSDQRDDAIKMLQQGIAAAQRKGDSHAQSEMQAMLDEMV
jgi:cytochrome c-type biogenesis protein CcmH/NrfG